MPPRIAVDLVLVGQIAAVLADQLGLQRLALIGGERDRGRDLDRRRPAALCCMPRPQRRDHVAQHRQVAVLQERVQQVAGHRIHAVDQDGVQRGLAVGELEVGRLQPLQQGRLLGQRLRRGAQRPDQPLERRLVERGGVVVRAIAGVHGITCPIPPGPGRSTGAARSDPRRGPTPSRSQPSRAPRSGSGPRTGGAPSRPAASSCAFWRITSASRRGVRLDLRADLLAGLGGLADDLLGFALRLGNVAVVVLLRPGRGFTRRIDVRHALGDAVTALRQHALNGFIQQQLTTGSREA